VAVTEPLPFSQVLVLSKGGSHARRSVKKGVTGSVLQLLVQKVRCVAQAQGAVGKVGNSAKAVGEGAEGSVGASVEYSTTSLRKIPEAVLIARRFLQAHKGVAAICHRPQFLIATGIMAGRTASCYRAVRQEFEAAGVNYLDREVVVDGSLVTSRQPADILA